jgi:redox-sensitive bicupin YhaK (pirin superfamily)
MLQIRRSNERGQADHGWLQSRHSFSFGDYFDPAHSGFRLLRVINEDRVRPAAGFGTHGHRDMEIISYVVSGSLAHKDSMGNGSVLKPGDVQVMSAGSGVQHSEMNPSSEEPAHFLQIWIVPERENLEPGYEEISLSATDKRNKLRLIGSGQEQDGVLHIHQDVNLYGSVLDPGREVQRDLKPGRHAWVQVIQGEISVNGQDLFEGDGAAISEEEEVRLLARTESELLLFDLA